VREDHVYMHLIESAPFNPGRNKVYIGVTGNLVEIVCRISFDRGFDGCACGFALRPSDGQSHALRKDNLRQKTITADCSKLLTSQAFI
jgi:hypothetical protein